MKVFLVLFLFPALIYSQNRYKDISNRRVKISRYVFSRILDQNSFDSSIMSRVIFKRHNLAIYSIETYSPHDIPIICIFYGSKMQLFRVESDENVKEILSFLKDNNICESILQKVNDEAQRILLSEE